MDGGFWLVGVPHVRGFAYGYLLGGFRIGILIVWRESASAASPAHSASLHARPLRFAALRERGYPSPPRVPLDLVLLVCYDGCLELVLEVLF